jgi:hypothetical protein
VNHSRFRRSRNALFALPSNETRTCSPIVDEAIEDGERHRLVAGHGAMPQ